MSATHHFFQRLRERYGVKASHQDVLTWDLDVAAGRAELVWVYPERGSRVYRLVHRRTHQQVFAVRELDRFITALVPWSYERLPDGWRQRSDIERIILARRRARFAEPRG